jgi:GNAT superfamily N-acetyltransferase
LTSIAMHQVRRATEADHEFVVRAQLAMALESEGLALDLATVQAGVRGVLDHPERGFYLIAEASGVACGCMLVLSEWSDWRSREVWWLHSVYVAPERRREGLFRGLYAYVTELGKRHGVAGLRLYVDRRNERAKAVYRALGMTDEHYELYEQLF